MSNQNGNNAAKVYLEGEHGIRVPARKISLTNGEDPVYVYDTSGPQGGNVRNGLPPRCAKRGFGRGAMSRMSHQPIAHNPGHRKSRRTCAAKQFFAARAMSRRCTMPNAVKSHPKWNLSPSGKMSIPNLCAQKSRGAAPSSRQISTTPKANP